jgi:hypothetical protein
MNEFDLRKFLYDNPLTEKKEDSKKGNKEEQKRMEGSIRDNEIHIDKLNKDIKADRKKLSRLKKDEPKDINEVEEVTETPKLTKEGLKSMIREKITSILNEEDKDMAEGAKYYEDDMKEAEEVDVDVDEKEDIDVDIEKDVKIDDESEEMDIEVDAEVAGQSADDSGLEGLLKKAREMARKQGDDKLVRQISNTIIQHERSIAAGEEA